MLGLSALLLLLALVLFCPQIHEDLGIVKQRPGAKRVEISLSYFKGPTEPGWGLFDFQSSIS